VIQALFIMGGNSKNSDEIREKSTRAILVTQAVNDLGYSILASFDITASQLTVHCDQLPAWAKNMGENP
jgi:hypothetical protein